MRSLSIENVRVFDPGRGIDAAGRTVRIEGGLIASLDARPGPADRRIDGRGLLLAPGLVDLRAHFSEPGDSTKETIASGVRAAARGGFTSVVLMPTTSPSIDRVEVVELILSRARAAGPTRVLPAGAVSVGREGERLSEMAKLASAGCVAFTDADRAIRDSQLLRYALEASLDLGAPIISHAEDELLSLGGVMHEGIVSTKLGLRGAPGTAEAVGVARDLAIAGLTRARLHLGHVSTAEAVTLIRQAKDRGLKVTAEVSPLHLALTDEAVLGYETNAKVFPPLRPRGDVDAMISGLADGTIDAVASDHRPETAIGKNAEFDVATPGAIALEATLGVVLRLVREGRLTLHRAIAVLTRGPADVLGRADLGRLTEGGPADMVLIDPTAEWLFGPMDIASRSANTPLLGRPMLGRTLLTVADGQITWERAE